MTSDHPPFDGPPLLGDMLGDAPADIRTPEPSEPADPLVGLVLADRYRILSKLGDGGMGWVYMAEQITLGKSVAIKLLKPEFNHDTGLVERFFREARATAAIQHENVVDILDFGQTPEYAFFVMEVLSGCELADLVGRGQRFDWERTSGIIVQVTRALGAAHAAGIIHRDMKPGNVFLIQRTKNADFVKVLDFGIAKIDDGVQLTQAGMVFGTASYMAPEQATGSAIDGRVDIYAIGCMLFEMLTGRLPFCADNFMQLLAKHIREPPPRLRDVCPDIQIPAGVEEIVARALAKHAHERFADMAELERALLSVDGPHAHVEPAHAHVEPAHAPAYVNAHAPAYVDAHAHAHAVAGHASPAQPSAPTMPAPIEHTEQLGLERLAYLFVAFAHGTDGVLTNAEMRTLADLLRGWAPQQSLDHVGAVLRDTVAIYGRTPDQQGRLREHQVALAATLTQDRLQRIVADLREIAVADGRFSAAEQAFIQQTTHAFGLPPERPLESLAFVYLALAHATEGAIDPEEMRVVGEQLRQWAPDASLSETGAALRDAVAEYKRLAGVEARIDRARMAADTLKQTLDQDTLRRVLADLWRISGADGHISEQEQRFIMEMVARFNS